MFFCESVYGVEGEDVWRKKKKKKKKRVLCCGRIRLICREKQCTFVGSS